MLQAHTIAPQHGSRHRKKRIGRGNASGHGTTATKGTKGQRARSGGRGGLQRLGFKLILQRIPKKRGFRSVAASVGSVTVRQLEQNFANGETVTLQKLVRRNLVSRLDTKAKIVGNGSLMKKFIVGEGVVVSAGAKAAIEKAGGSVSQLKK